MVSKYHPLMMKHAKSSIKTRPSHPRCGPRLALHSQPAAAAGWREAAMPQDHACKAAARTCQRVRGGTPRQMGAAKEEKFSIHQRFNGIGTGNGGF
jgi:hypothetical protein